MNPNCEWEIIEENLDKMNIGRNETIFALGNGYLGTRGTLEEGRTGLDGIGYEGTYINGFYESRTIDYPEVAYGYPDQSQTMLNVTNGKSIQLWVEDEPFNMFSGILEEYVRKLSMRDGLLTRELVWCSPGGKRVQIIIERLVSLSRQHVMAIRLQIIPLNFVGTIKLSSALDADVLNLTSGQDPRIGSAIRDCALKIVEKCIDHQKGCILHETKQSKISLACAMRHQLKTSGTFFVQNSEQDRQISTDYTIAAIVGEPITLEKYVAYYTSRDKSQSQLRSEAELEVRLISDLGFTQLKNEQTEFLIDFWSQSDVVIKGAPALQQGIRFNLFHLLQSVGRDGWTAIGAKGLTGEGYEGHYFWDTEMFVLPFFLFTKPEISRKLLEFRYHTLDQARRRARQLLFHRGALFPWRTINGDECSAYYPAGTAQYHINADIAFAIKKYMSATQDTDFLLNFGAEIIFETARIWSQLGFFNENKDNRFCINCVTGPDEYNALVDNNCYTNLMARENLLYANEVAAWMHESEPEQYMRIASKIGLDEQELINWQDVANNIYIPFDQDSQIYFQDDGFRDRMPMDISTLSKDKLPLLLHYHPLDIYRRQVCKQADLVHVMFLLGDRFSRSEKIINFDFYEKITTHDSSLSKAIFSIVASEIDYHQKAYDYFFSTARLDLDDCHGNTSDGIHTANMAGTWMCIVFGFAGLRDYHGYLQFSPYLPVGWDEYSFRLVYRGRQIEVKVERSQTTYRLLHGEAIMIEHFSNHNSFQFLLCRSVEAATAPSVCANFDADIDFAT